MKRLLLLLCLVIPCLSCSGNHCEAAEGSRISSAISECRHYKGVDYLRLGRVATGAIKGIVRFLPMGDSEAKKAVCLMKGIHGLTVIQYEDCSEADKSSISLKLADALADSEILLEVSDSGEKVKIYGTYDERSDKVRDFILFVPSESALISIRGSISMDSIARIVSHD